MGNVHQEIIRTQVVPPGFYWATVPYGEYPQDAVRYDPRMQTRASTGSRDEGQSFALIEVLEPVPLESWEWLGFEQWGHAPNGLDTSPYDEGVWVQPGPSWTHHASEVVEDVKKAASFGSGLVLWAAGGALAVGLAIYLARTK